MILKDLIIFLTVYYILNLTYRFWLTEKQQRNFETISVLFMKGNDLIPITFVLGFFVNQVAKRWWDIFLTIAWPDRLASYVSLYIKGIDAQGRMIRRTLVRYINLSALFVFRDISTAVKKRFPTLKHLVNSGFITEGELRIYEESFKTYVSIYMFWLPLQWACNLLTKAKKEGRIDSEVQYKTMMNEILKMRTQIGMLSALDWVPTPLVYTQVVIIAVYSFFCLCLLSRQFSTENDSLNTNNIPFFLILEFIFYDGLLKVAQVLLNPFGEDDDDFEMNYIIDRNLQISYLIVDEFCDYLPPLTFDIYARRSSKDISGDGPFKAGQKRAPFKPSTAGLQIPLRLQTVVDSCFDADKRDCILNCQRQYGGTG